jgi:hypothetical protein
MRTRAHTVFCKAPYDLAGGGGGRDAPTNGTTIRVQYFWIYHEFGIAASLPNRHPQSVSEAPIKSRLGE